MKKTSVFALSLLFAGSLLQAAKPVVAVAVPLKAAEGAKLTVHGDSTMHKWKADAQEVVITAEQSKAGDLLAAVQGQGLSKLVLGAKSASLKSNEGKSMDKNMHKAMNAKDFPDISFSMTSYELKGDQVAAQGVLNIHGQPKDVLLPGTVTAKDGGVNVKGSYSFKMSEHGIKPPVMMLGTIRVADELRIDYDFTLVP